MEFAQWLEQQELNEGLASGAIQKLQSYFSTLGNASKAEYIDLKNAFHIYKSRLSSMFDGVDKPTREQILEAQKAMLAIPKLAAVIVPLVMPVPGMFTSLMVVSIIAKRFFGISLLPKHFEAALLSPGGLFHRFMG